MYTPLNHAQNFDEELFFSRFKFLTVVRSILTIFEIV
jgi:hypothetical protein